MDNQLLYGLRFLSSAIFSLIIGCTNRVILILKIWIKIKGMVDICEGIFETLAIKKLLV